MCGAGLVGSNGGRIVHEQRAQTGFFEPGLQGTVGGFRGRVVTGAPHDGLGTGVARRADGRARARPAPHDQPRSAPFEFLGERRNRPAKERGSPRTAPQASFEEPVENQQRHDRAAAVRFRESGVICKRKSRAKM